MELLLGDCLDRLKELEDNSVDAIVCDPPYGLSFMGKKWDYDVPSVDIWKECLRVLKPGGYLLSFAGTRTQHRMAVNIEDAGFEIRDMIAWVYGSGFPKSLNIGKAVDKLQGNEREVLGTRKVPDQRSGGINSERTAQMGVPTRMTTDTKGTSEWEGWGTALKPALEPITVARKPIEGTVAENCLKWGVGGINIDGCRVETSDKYSYPNGAGGNSFSIGEEPDGKRTEPVESNNLGRFPANLIHDGSEEVRECFPESKGGAFPKTHGSSGFVSPEEKESRVEMNDSGNASRFFKSIIYTAKASKRERNRGCEGLEEKIVNDGREKDIDNAYQRGITLRKNTHPTVKPIALMEYLVKMVSREGQVVLDPFMGSGTTGMACKKLNREFIGIEMMPEYMEIAKCRIEATKKEDQLNMI